MHNTCTQLSFITLKLTLSHSLFKTHLSLCFLPVFKQCWWRKPDQGWLTFTVIQSPSVKDMSTGWSVCPSHPFLNFCLTIFTTLGSFYTLLSSIGFLRTALRFPSDPHIFSPLLRDSFSRTDHCLTYTHTHTQENVQQCSCLEVLFKIMDISDLLCSFLLFTSDSPWAIPAQGGS